MNKVETLKIHQSALEKPQQQHYIKPSNFGKHLSRSTINRFLSLGKKSTSDADGTVQMIYPEEKHKLPVNRLLDSEKFIHELLRFSSSSLFSFLVDIGLFSLTFRLLQVSSYPIALLLATGFARLISSIVNFTINKKFVFMDSGSTHSQLIKYYLLCLVQMLFSWLILYGLSSIMNMKLVFIKIITDVFLFISSFTMQRFFIFRRTIHFEKAK